MSTATAERGGFNNKEAAKLILSAVFEVLDLNQHTGINTFLATLEGEKIDKEAVKKVQQTIMVFVDLNPCKFTDPEIFSRPEMKDLRATGVFDQKTKAVIALLYQTASEGKKREWEKFPEGQMKMAMANEARR